MSVCDQNTERRQLSTNEKDALIKDATTLALGELASWQRPKVLPGVGPRPVDIFFDFERDLSELRSDIEARARKIPAEVLQREYCGQIGLETSPFTQEHGIHHATSARIRALSSALPEWFAGGWTVKGRLPDGRHWKSANVLTLEEAALLTVGVEPKLVDYSQLFGAYGKDVRSDRVLYFLEDRYEEIARGVGVNPDPKSKIEVDQLADWIVSEGVSVATEFRVIFKSKFTSAESASRKDTSDMHHHTEHALHRIIVTLAISRHKLSSEKDVGRVARLIVADGDLLGFRLSQRALQKTLLAGFKQLSDDAKKKIQD